MNELTAAVIEGFAGMFLSKRYDDPKPTPPFHREVWGSYGSNEKAIVVAAPRDHAKSTGFTFDYGLAEVCFRISSYVIIIGSTEEKAAEQLSNLSEELHENEDIRKEFGISHFETDQKTEIIVVCDDGYRFRILARGAEQKIRGALWNGKRPDLLLCHEKGTMIEADGMKMLVENHATAQIVIRDGFQVSVHGLPFNEVVTPEHRYLVKTIKQKKCADYLNGVKVRNYTKYIPSNPEWREAQTLSGDCWIGAPVDMSVGMAPSILSHFNNKDFWWLLGLWWGDGSLGSRTDESHNSKSVCWYVAYKDAETIGLKVLSYFKNLGIHVSVYNHEGCVSLTVTDEELANWLRVWKRGNSMKLAPEWVLKLPVDQQTEIIKGYIAADGWIDNKNQQVRLTSIYLDGLLQVRKMLARIGVVGTIRHGMKKQDIFIDGRLVTAQKKYDLMFRDGASKLGFDLTDSERYALKKVFIEDDILWSQFFNKVPVQNREFVPIQTESHTYTTNFGLSHNCDDMEDDEQVESKERRAKFRRWFFRAAKQALSKKGRIRVHGTILHEDSLLARLIKNKMWKHHFYKAHEGYNDFSNLLWPERWTAKDLRARQIEFEEDGDAPGYSQEFLNTPLDNNEAYLRKQDFLPMTEDDREKDKLFGVGVDFAISKETIANKTAFVIGGKDQENLLHISDVRLGRLGALEIVDEFFSIQKRWNPQAFWVENGQIWLAIVDILYSEMRRRDIWLNCIPLPSIKDKGVRGRAMQKRHRSGGMRFDKQAEWYPGYEAELLRFTTGSQAIADDQFDGTSILCRGLETFQDVTEEDFMEDEEFEEERESRYTRGQTQRNTVTGY